jgi:hypothetical protein
LPTICSNYTIRISVDSSRHHALRDRRVADATAPPSFRSGVELLRLDVTAIDGRGQPVPDLGPVDFRVEVDGRERRVMFARYFGPEDDFPLRNKRDGWRRARDRVCRIVSLESRAAGKVSRTIAIERL